MITTKFSDLALSARTPDVAIVGAGAVGIALAVLLARQGVTVTLIEAGPVKPPIAFRKAKRTLVHAGCNADRIVVIPYGSPPPTAVLKSRPRGSCRFLFVGQGVQRKGLHHLAEAWRLAALQGCELTVASYLIDPGIAPMLELPGVRLLGRQNSAELASLFAAADAFVMPSLVEGFGLVYLEALAAGCHVLGTGNTGLPDMELSNVAATIIPPGEPDTLASALTAIAQRKASDGLDPEGIRAEAARWGWSDFRCSIAAHAESLLCQAVVD